LNNTYALLVPCYNAEDYIAGFMRNLGELSRSFDEVIFYDDASTDNTLAILSQQGCRVISGEVNRGPGYARNSLVSATGCRWFHFHDIDDRMDRDYLKKTAEIAERNSGTDVILCNVDWYNEGGNSVALSWRYSDVQIKANPVSYTISKAIGGINGLYRKEKFLQTGGFNTELRIWEDADIHVRLAAHGAIFHVVEEVLATAIRYTKSASSDQVTGWLNRLSCLQYYFTLFSDQMILREIGVQSQLNASQLILCGEYGQAKKALLLSERCGVQVPDNKTPEWTLLKAIAPSWIRIPLRVAQLKHAFLKSRNKKKNV